MKAQRHALKLPICRLQIWCAWARRRGGPRVRSGWELIIVSASDGNFLPGLLVLLYSAWLHNRKARFYVIDAGLGLDGTAKVASLCARHGIDCHIRQADTEQLSRLPSAGHLSSATYARLFIPDLLPGHDRAIYIDSDALVVGDLEPLWRLDLGDDLLAAVVDPGMTPASLATLGFASGQYVNAGVLLVDLARWRAEEIGARCMDQLLRHPKLEHADQTAINIVARGRIRHLDPSFNFFAATPLTGDGPDPRILHFPGPDKPWRRAGLPFGGVFDAYGRASGADLPTPSRARRFQSLRKTVLGLLALRPKYWRALRLGIQRRLLVRRQIRAVATHSETAGQPGPA
jgi:hypothetical protein